MPTHLPRKVVTRPTKMALSTREGTLMMMILAVGGKASTSAQECRKGITWTKDEHRLFLLGLEKYGKGDQRSISRNFVMSRTPTQVASHAHKRFIRLNSINKDRRRSSIHDITTVTNGDTSPVKLMPLWKLQGSLQKFFSIICRPLIPAAGTPVNLPVPAASPMVYPLQTPFSGAVVSAPL
ncbi:hypothetical protein C4D60_Mb03t13860 [Musa balbisiana]|uniref:HTH myb-type domain-containing protein n=1 Tax=Musa balbisiana TaxID=52838 RepID=A0A4S8JC65_MUSBA|nr:hypothetical protein C4D60_Mb03t13860 [Musa balbisiana]